MHGEISSGMALENDSPPIRRAWMTLCVLNENYLAVARQVRPLNSQLEIEFVLGKQMVNVKLHLDLGPKTQSFLEELASIGQELEKINSAQFHGSKKQMFRAFASLVLAYNQVCSRLARETDSLHLTSTSQCIVLAA